MLEIKNISQEFTILCFSGWAHDFSWIKPQNHTSKILFVSNQELFQASNLDEDGYPKFDFLLKKSPPYLLIGWSLGGMLCLDFVRLYSHLVKALIMISSTSMFTELGKQKESFRISKNRMELFKASFDNYPERTAFNFYKDIHTTKDNLDVFFRENFHSSSIDTFRAGLGYLQNKNLNPYLSKIETKTLLLHGENDKLIPCAASKFLNNNLKNSKLEIMLGFGHDLPYAGFSKLNQKMETFLRKV